MPEESPIPRILTGEDKLWISAYTNQRLGWEMFKFGWIAFAAGSFIGFAIGVAVALR